MELSHRKRIEKTIAGQSVDRPAVALWRHFPGDDQSAESLARSVVNFQKRFDFDFIKITPASSYCLQGWGVEDEWQGNPEGSRKIIKYPISKATDWENISFVSSSFPSLSEQLRCIRLIRHEVGQDTPIIQTIFSPLSQAKNLVGKENLPSHLRMYPAQTKKALQIITATTISFLEESIKAGVDGIFFAIQMATFDYLSEIEFEEFGKLFDMQILKVAEACWFNVGHLHGTNVMFEKVSKYPVQVLNWHDQETFPSLSTGKELFRSGAVCGGLRQWETLTYGSPQEVLTEARKAGQETNGERFILGTGCVAPVIAPDSNLFAARKSVEGLGK